MPSIHSNIISTIGKTPLVRLNTLTKGIKATVLAKLEFSNPGEASKTASVRL